MAPAVSVDVAASGITVSSTASVAFGGLNGYWGQLGSDSMESYCDKNPEYITIAFVNSSPENEPSGWPGTNFAGHCPGDYFNYTDSNGNSQRSDLWKNCYLMMEGIPYCQERGVKVLLSIGGEFTSTSNYTVSTEANGIAFADWLYKAFGPKQDDYNGPRPFDASTWTTHIDGFDFDIEVELDNTPYIAMINRFRELDSSLVITGAPQCRLESQYFHMMDMVTNAKFDALFIQFYNNDYCDLISDSGSVSDPLSNSNYDAWEEFLAGTQSSGAKIYVGLPASSDAASSGYVDAGVVQTIVQELQGRSSFGGVSIWDFTRGASNIDETTGYSFNDMVQNVVDYGTTIAPTPTTTTSSAPTTTTTTTSTTSAETTTTTEAETTTTTEAETTSSTSTISSSSTWAETTTTTSTTSTPSKPTTTTDITSVETTTDSSTTSTWEPTTTAETTTGIPTSTTSAGSTPTETTTDYELPTSTEATTETTGITTSSTSTTEGSATTTTDCTTEVETPETTTDCESDIETNTTSGVESSTVSASITSETSGSTSAEYSSTSVEYSSSETSGITLTASVPTTAETIESSTFSTTDAQSTLTPSHGPSSYSSFYPTTNSSTPATLPTSSHGSDSVGTTTESASPTTSTVYTTHIYTVTKCPPEVTNCPSKGHYVTTEVIPLYTTVCPVQDKPAPSTTTDYEAQVTKSAGYSHPANGGGKPQQTTEGNAGYTSEVKTLYETKIYTVTKCPPSVTNCPLNSVTTEVSSWTTTVAPVQTTPAGEHGAVPEGNAPGHESHEASVPAEATTTQFISVVVVKPQLPKTSNYLNATAHYSSPEPTTKLPVGGAAPTGGCVGDECSTSSHSYTVPAATGTNAPLTAGASNLCAGLTFVLALAGLQMFI